MKKRALTTIRTNARTFLLARLLLYALGISAAAKRENRRKSIGRLTDGQQHHLKPGVRGGGDVWGEQISNLSLSESFPRAARCMIIQHFWLRTHTRILAHLQRTHAHTHARYSAGNRDFRSRLKSLCVRV